MTEAVEPTAIELKADILCWRLDALLFDRCQLIKDVVLYWTVGECGKGIPVLEPLSR